MKKTLGAMIQFLLFIFLFNISLFKVEAQVVLKATVLQDGAIVYNKPDFDAEVVTYLSKKDTVIVVNPKLFGPFFKIQTATNQIGYISDVDIKIIGKLKHIEKKQSVESQTGNAKKSKAKKAESALKETKKKRPQLPIDLAPFFGVSYYNISYVENTQGSKRKSKLDSFGLKITGGDLLIRGGVPMEINFNFSSTAPSYYKELTGNDPSIATTILLDTQFVDKFAGDRNSMAFFGFGPLIKYSRYIVQGKFSNKLTNFDMANLNLGAVMSLGFTKRFDRFAIRADAKYFIEKTQYNALGIAFLFEH